jgi:hypothetical protein
MSIKPIIKIHNVETNEVIEREMTEDEISQLEADKLADEKLALLQAEQDAKAKADKAAAEAKLAVLGLTTDDLKALGLGNN